jgi:hypothetical protein
MDLISSANSALQESYNILPDYFKNKPVGFTLAAPATVSLTVVAGSDSVQTSAFTAAQFGRSVIIDGDSQTNQIIGTAKLLNAYQGGTGTATATIYGDSVFTDQYPLDRVLDNPRFTGHDDWPLFHSEGMASELVVPEVGLPRYWWAETFGNSQGVTPMLCIKFFPYPSIAYPISMRFSFWAKRLTLSDYDSNTTLPIPDQFIDTALVPLGKRAFMSSPAWEDRKDADLVMAAAQRAEDFLRKQPGQIAVPDNRISTPLGY